jgi:SRSO17 transposase
MTKLEKVLYTARAHTTGGREGGTSRTDDGRLVLLCYIICKRATGGRYSACMQWNAKQLRRSIQRFKAFMVPLVALLGRSERRAAATSYVQGLLMPGQRKSIEPMAERLGVPSQRLQQFVTDSPWDDNELWGLIRRRVLPHLEPLEAWIVDETGWLKQGRHSVGVARQYCGAVGKRANCQGERGVGGQ